MTTKKNDTLRSIAGEPVTIMEARPPSTVTSDLHPALDPGAEATSTATQRAIDMNMPADRAGIPYSGEALAVTPPAEPVKPAYSGEGLLTVSQEAALRVHDDEKRGIN
ncbi:hypothetical protein [Sphingobium sp.]|uniref:hypothetical protein n=1 Tax=Sphingobium sp. TaxID=1912891 RepID=UPI003BB4D2D0